MLIAYMLQISTAMKVSYNVELDYFLNLNLLFELEPSNVIAVSFRIKLNTPEATVWDMYVEYSGHHCQRLWYSASTRTSFKLQNF